MDFAGSVGVSKVKPYADSDQEVWVRWYRCQEGALPFPQLNAFGNAVWNSHDDDDYVGPGILFHGAEQRQPLTSPFPGTHFEGQISEWQNGMPVAERDQVAADVCGLPLLPASGGILIGGTAWATRARLAGGGSLRSVVRNPPQYRGLLAGGGALHSLVRNPARYVGLLAGGGALHSTTRSDRTYSARLLGSGALHSLVRNPARYVGLLAGGGALHSTSAQAGQYTGGLAVQGRFASIATRGHIYAGKLAGGGSLDGVYTPPNPLVFVGSCAITGVYTYWTLTLAGVTGSGDCPGANGTRSPTYSSGAQWRSTEVWPSTTNPYCVMQYSGVGTTWTLEFFDSTGSPQASYHTTAFNCQAANTFTLLVAFQCSTWPSSLTVSPA